MIDVELQVIGGALRAVAEEMGAALIRAAFSSNIKERRDCSTALFDGVGRMVVQAEHIPVHLGAMPEAVAAVMAHDPAPGEVWALNDPYAGGTHLPDITLVSRTDLGFAVSRAHHADVGGIEPASLPAFSTDLFEEGLVIPPTHLDDELVEHIAASSRNPDERRGDLRAQLAAHRLAERRTAELVSRRGGRRVEQAMDELYAYSARRVRAGLAGLPNGRYEAEDVIEAVDGDLVVRAAVTIAGDEVEIDFSGTATQHRGNLNCPLSVTRSACFFVVRALTDPEVPASGGAFEPVTVVAPEGCLVNARFPAAVVAGNTETSSRITDVVTAAFGRAVDVPAMGQGTMNNTTFGTDEWTYYETIGGGQGASARADGPSGVHVAMSNALSTPVEALEIAYPLRVERYALRLGSGGAGLHRGGDGVLREVRVLEPCRLSVLGDRRRHPPRGARGGANGARGRTLVDGEEIPGKDTRQLQAGQVLRVETPGGGGYGTPPDPGSQAP
jgi:N-methylhydantoinase B